MKPFECITDRWGNILMAAGSVVNVRQGQVLAIDARALDVAKQALPDLNGRRSFLGLNKQVFLGGSGRNLKAETSGGTLVPVGYFTPTVAGTWKGTLFPGMKVTFNSGTGAAAINDGTSDIATGTGFTTAPVGTFTLTSYGRTNYNGGAAGTITTTWEGGGTIPGCSINPTTSLIAADTLTASTPQLYNADTLTGWKIVVNNDGSAALNDGTSDVATRAAGLAHDPAGNYTSTVYGAANWGDGGADFTVYVQTRSKVPIAGWVYGKIVESSPGVIASVAGPFFATTVPANSGANHYVPIAYSDGAGNLTQYQEGPIQWSSFETIPWVTLTAAEYLALGTPDANTIYDISDAIP
jgi:hypothetical protein